MNARLALALALALPLILASCAGAPMSEGAPTRALPSPESAPKATSVVAPASTPPSETPASLAATTALTIEFERVLTAPVSAIGIGEGTRVGVLADQPYVGDARGIAPLPLPAALRAKPGEVDRLGIYFGRDNEPRVMGSRTGESGERAVYFRHLPNGWRDGREEIGQLGGAVPFGLWGVLGSADPELVCRVNSLCIIKRRSGWTLAPAGANARLVTLQDGVLWGLDASGIAGIDKRGWATVIAAPGAWQPRALWATAGEAWVSTADELWHFHDGKWASVASPVGAVAAFWGSHRSSVWLAGAEGAAYFDGQALKATTLREPLGAANGRSDAEVWLGGPTGLYRVRRPG